MRTIKTTLQLDFTQSDSCRTIHVKQYDAGGGRQIEIELLDNGEVVSLVSGDTAKLYASVGHVVTANGTSCLINNNKIYVNISDNLTGLSGLERCDIEISNSGKIIHTATFYLYVGAAAVNDDTGQYIPSELPTQELEEIESDLEDLETRVQTLETDVSTLQTDVGTAQSDIASLKTRVTTVEGQIEFLTGKLHDLYDLAEYHIDLKSQLPVMIDPSLTRHVYTEVAANLPISGGFQKYTIPLVDFDPDIDGLMMYHSLFGTIISPDHYEVTKTGTNAVVTFYNSVTGKSVTVLGTFTAYVFMRPRNTGGE